VKFGYVHFIKLERRAEQREIPIERRHDSQGLGTGLPLCSQAFASMGRK
jgi:hypothetical protein